MKSKSQLRKKECPLCLGMHGINDSGREDWTRLCEKHKDEYEKDIKDAEMIGLKMEEAREKRISLNGWRKARGWTRAKLANELGTTETSIYRWETGRHPIPAWVLRFLAQLTNREGI